MNNKENSPGHPPGGDKNHPQHGSHQPAHGRPGQSHSHQEPPHEGQHGQHSHSSQHEPKGQHEHGQHQHQHGHHGHHEHGHGQQHQQGHPAQAAPNHPAATHPADRPHTGEQKKHHWVTWILVLAVLVMAVVVFRIITSKPKKTPMPPPPSVTLTNVQQGDIQISVIALGSVQPIYTASISPRVDGQLLSVNYTEGQMVHSNDLLAQIDPAPYQALVTQASGQLARDEAVLAGAKIDLQRYEAALQKNAVPKQQYDDQVALVRQDEGTVKFDQGQVATAKVNLDYCSIRAPIEGRIGLRLIDPGNIVHAANTNAMLVIAQLQPIDVVFGVAEDYLPQIQAELKAGHQMTVEAYDRAQETNIATGQYLTMDNLIDMATGTIKIKASFSNDDSALFPNQFVNAKLIIKTLHDVPLIPTYAIQRNPEGMFVYVATNGTLTTNGTTTNFTAVTMRNITIGTTDGTISQVTTGLNPGDRIALDNFNKLGEGTKIQVHKPGEDAKGGANGMSGAPGAHGGDGGTNGATTHHHKKPDADAKDGS